MSRNQQRLLRLCISILGTLTLTSALLGQASTDSEKSAPVINDWSHHRLIFSKPANAEQARRVQRDPRYWQQLALQSRARVPEAMSGASAYELPVDSNALRPRHRMVKRDWSEDLGPGASVGAGSFPMKYSFGITSASCNDFVVYGTGLEGGAGQASVVAYNNLYVPGCGAAPTVSWAYNTGGTILTSPVPSLDGTQIAYVQRDGSLILLKWAASGGTFSSPGTPPTVSNAAYTTCTAPCMTMFDLRNRGGVADLDHNSSIYYDYISDTAYVGDDSGFLHKFTPVFNGVIAEVGGAWPVQVNATAPTALSSPVYDSVSGNVFVGDAGGYLYWVGPTAAVTQSGRLDYGTGIVDSPMVDSTAGSVYVFSSSDDSGGCPIGTGGANCSVVFVANTSFSGGDVGPRAIVGTSTVTGTMPSPLHDGDFDSTYKNSVDATGNLYVCGNTGGDPILYQVAVAAGSFGTVNTGPILSSSTMPCSPVTDVVNPNAPAGPTEWIFASAEADGVSTPCGSSGCIFNFKVTPWQPSTAYTVGQEVLDSHFQIQAVSVAGTSGATAPGWSTTAGGSTHDGSKLTWVDQGVQSAFTPAAWAPSFAYSAGTSILDSNGNIEIAFDSGTSGGSTPLWSTTPGFFTGDAGVAWVNLGAPATAAMASTGGTSGIIIDNTVGSGTEPGASQVYFSTLGNQACTGGTGGCAVQASQPALQ